MIAAVLLFLKRWQYYLIASLWAASLIGAIYQTRQITLDGVELTQVKEVVRIVEKRNAIANRRPDTDTVINQLRSDPNW